MTLYTRPQLAVLLLAVITAGIGLGVGHWRRTHPELVERIESFDHAPTLPRPATAEPRAPATPRARSEPPRSRATPQNSAAPAQPVDINRASEEELRVLPGIGGVLAARIVEARLRDGPFASFDDLRRVRGIGRAKLERLAAAIALGP
jgi:competence protein ComEA